MRAPMRRRCAAKSMNSMGAAGLDVLSGIDDFLQAIPTSEAIAPPAARADEVGAELLAVMAHPADAARRRPHHQRKGGHILGNDRTRADEAIFAERHAAN